MTTPLRFCFGLHLHQPVGNFDSVFRDHLDAVYSPLLDGLESGDTWPVTLHVSGPLLDWLERHAIHWVDRLGAHVAAGRIELLSAGHDEPILVALSSDDRIEQVTRLRDRLRHRFGVDATGLWLTERVWESDLPRDLAGAGIRFVVVDDRHLRVTGIPSRQLHRPWVTEWNGSQVSVLAIDQRLRYLVPFQPVDRLEEYFVALRADGHRLAVLADDGEKFGGWPGTAKWVWQEGWFRSFTSRMSELSERGEVVLSTMADAIAALPSRGPVYLPSASYHEMERWSLPAAQARRLEWLEENAPAAAAGVDDEALLRGGHWRHFLTKYPESNRMHKVMQHLSRRCRDMGELPEARRHIGRAQCNDAYWHGVFGGAYLPFLRAALWRELATAGELLHQDAGIDATRFDIDGDGHEEILVTSPCFLALLAPSRGGAVEVLLRYSDGINLADVMARHEEAYHPAPGETVLHKVVRDESDGSDGTASIHDLETTLAERPPLDSEPRALLVDRFIGEAVTVQEFISGTVLPIRSFASVAMQAKVSPAGSGIAIECSAAGVRKLLRFGTSGSLEVEWNWEPRAWPAGALLSTELSLPSEGTTLEASGAERWEYPIETVSKSEKGFDRTAQGTAFVFTWPAAAGSARILIS
ncbi:MAG TPA: DUF1926 domain-containing protein [Gemmatimonadales bacterium]|nr:DUF1926 domain-containing protein [Gemmatimonadales bacterium]